MLTHVFSYNQMFAKQVFSYNIIIVLISHRMQQTQAGGKLLWRPQYSTHRQQ